MITIYILSNISRSKGNQTMKFGQLIERSITNIFLEKSYTKRGGEISCLIRSCLGYDVTNFELILAFLSSRFST